MKFLFLLFFYSSLVASEVSRGEYLELLKAHPEVAMPRGDASKGEIEILLDPEKMATIEMATGRDVGILKSDRHWIWLNDACGFPDGTEGVIGRILARSLEHRPGAAVLPVLPDGKIVLNRILLNRQFACTKPIQYSVRKEIERTKNFTILENSFGNTKKRL